MFRHIIRRDASLVCPSPFSVTLFFLVSAHDFLSFLHAPAVTAVYLLQDKMDADDLNKVRAALV